MPAGPALPCTYQSQPAAPSSRIRNLPWRPQHQGATRAAAATLQHAVRKHQPRLGSDGQSGAGNIGKKSRAPPTTHAYPPRPLCHRPARKRSPHFSPPTEGRLLAGSRGPPLTPWRSNQREERNTKSRLPDLLIASFASVKIGELRGGEREVKGHFPRGFAPRGSERRRSRWPGLREGLGCPFNLADGVSACELVQQYLRGKGFVPSSRKRAEVKAEKGWCLARFQPLAYGVGWGGGRAGVTSRREAGDRLLAVARGA